MHNPATRIVRAADAVISRLTRQPGRILVVDDDATNRMILRDPLEANGYAVAEAEDGERALQAVLQDAPDLLLLDVMMPELDGFSVCRRIKNNPLTAAIPVLMVTALADRDARVQGIESGADDFLTKPLDIQEVLLRVHNAMYLKRLGDHARENYERLRQLEQLRDELVHMIVHDMRSPLMGLAGNLELLEQHPLAGDADAKAMITEARTVAASLTEMISEMLDVSRLETGQMPVVRSPRDMRDLVQRALVSVLGLARLSGATLACEMPPEPLVVACDAQLVERIISNLVSNAIHCLADDGTVRVTAQRDGGGVRVAVSDTGPGIPMEFQDRIFEKFAQVGRDGFRKRHSSGVGLTFCRMAVEAHGGRIGVDSDGSHGSTFWFVIPDTV